MGFGAVGTRYLGDRAGFAGSGACFLARGFHAVSQDIQGGQDGLALGRFDPLHHALKKARHEGPDILAGASSGRGETKQRDPGVGRIGMFVDQPLPQELGGDGRDPAFGHAQAPAEFAGSQIAVFAQGKEGAQGGRRQAEPLALHGDAGLATGKEIFHRFLQASGLAGSDIGVGGRYFGHDAHT